MIFQIFTLRATPSHHIRFRLWRASLRSARARWLRAKTGVGWTLLHRRASSKSACALGLMTTRRLRQTTPRQIGLRCPTRFKTALVISRWHATLHARST